MALPQTALKSQPAPRVESKTACGQTAGEIKADIDPLQAYKKTVDLWLWLDIFRGQQTSVSRAKRVITKYKKALGDPVGLAVALVFYCDRAAGFCHDVQHQDTAYFDALVRMFEQALKARANLTGNVQTRMIDMSPKGMTASTSRAMPTDRLSTVSIITSTTNPATTSRTPLGRSQARVSASDAGGFRPNVPEIRSGDKR